MADLTDERRKQLSDEKSGYVKEGHREDMRNPHRRGEEE